MLLGAGLAIFTYNFVDDLVLQAQNEMYGLLNNLPSDIIGLISILKVPQALSVIMSALVLLLLLNVKVFGRAT